MLGTPCLTYRTTTERPITVELGTNELVGVDPEALREAAQRVAGRRRPGERTRDPALGREGGPARRGGDRGISRRLSKALDQAGRTWPRGRRPLAPHECPHHEDASRTLVKSPARGLGAARPSRAHAGPDVRPGRARHRRRGVRAERGVQARLEAPATATGLDRGRAGREGLGHERQRQRRERRSGRPSSRAGSTPSSTSSRRPQKRPFGGMGEAPEPEAPAGARGRRGDAGRG